MMPLSQSVDSMKATLLNMNDDDGSGENNGGNTGGYNGL
jgi:hypothetical protein